MEQALLVLRMLQKDTCSSWVAFWLISNEIADFKVDARKRPLPSTRIHPIEVIVMATTLVCVGSVMSITRV